MDAVISCPHCGKVCETERGLTQHTFRTPDCNKQHNDGMAFKRSEPEAAEAGGGEATNEDAGGYERRSSKRVAIAREKSDREAALNAQNEVQQDADHDGMADSDSGRTDSDNDDCPVAFTDPTDACFWDSSDSESDASDDESEPSTDEKMNDDETKGPDEPNRSMLQGFRDYCDSHEDNYLRLKEGDKTSIRLMAALKLKKAPLNAHKALLEWHLKETGALQSHESLRDTPNYQSRPTLIDKLKFWYNASSLFPKVKKLKLPHSKAVVSIVWTDIKDAIVSLLTDPRFEDSDYLFHDDNPLAPPPDDMEYIEDLNTGDAYVQSHRQMVTEPNQQVCPIIGYIDGAVTGQFVDLPITAFKITLGIFKREVRDREHAWRIIGYVPQVRKEQSRGKQMFKESKHMESQDVVVMQGEGEQAGVDSEDEASADEDDEGTAVKAQDFHTTLSFLLKSLVELQRTGFIWDLVHKKRLCKNIHFLPFVAFIKCDTEEGDMLCGKHTIRTKNVAHLC